MTPAAKASFVRADRAAKNNVSVPFPAVLFTIALLWTAYFLLMTLRGAILEMDMQAEIALRRGMVTLAGIGLTLVMWTILRLFDRRALWIRIGVALVLAMPVAIAMGQVNHRAFQDIMQDIASKYAEERGLRFDDEGNLLYDLPAGSRVEVPAPDGTTPGQPSETLVIAPAEARQDQWRAVLEIALGRYFLLIAWSSLYFALLAGYQARAAERREQQFRSAAKAAELRSLRYQVNPHFLFNTLNSLSALVMTGKPQRAESMIQSISRFYRHSLADEPTSDVRLSEEFDLQREYLEIEAVRFPERLRVKFDLPDDLADACVPGMILQPMVENSVKYGVSPVSRPVTITLAAREEFDRLVVTVSDDGPGVSGSAGPGFGIGLANVSDRLEARFGPDMTLATTALEPGYRTEIRIPLFRKAR